VVAQVDEDHAAVIATRVDPPAERDGPAEQGLVDETAVVGTHEIVTFAPDGAGKREMLRRKLLRCNVGQEIPCKKEPPPKRGFGSHGRTVSQRQRRSRVKIASQPASTQMPARFQPQVRPSTHGVFEIWRAT